MSDGRFAGSQACVCSQIAKRRVTDLQSRAGAAARGWAVVWGLVVALGHRRRRLRSEAERRSASTYAGLMSPTVRGSSMGLRSVRRGSEFRRCVLVVCMFRTREPSRGHPAPCGLFVPARGVRNVFAFGGMAPKFFRWIHGAPHRIDPTLKHQARGSFGGSPNFIKKT
jgi:hypothetical protein